VYGWDGLHRFDASADVEAINHLEAAKTFMLFYPFWCCWPNKAAAFNPRHWKPHQLRVEHPDGSDLKIFEVKSRNPLVIESAP